MIENLSKEPAGLRAQIEEAQSRLDALLAQREAAMEGCGWCPSQAEIDKARNVVEAAASLLLRISARDKEAA